MLENSRPANWIARVGTQYLSTTELLDFHRSSGSLENSPEKLKKTLGRFIESEVLAQELTLNGHGQDTTLRLIASRARTLALIAKLKATIRKNAPPPTDAQARNYFQEHIEDFAHPVSVRFEQLVFREQNQAKKAIATLIAGPHNATHFKSIAARLKSALARRYRGPTPAVSLNDPESQLPPPIVQAAFDIPSVGETLPQPIVSDIGYHVIRLVERQLATNDSFEHAHPRIHRLLDEQSQEEAAIELVANVKRKTKTEIYPKAVTKHWRDIFAAARHPGDPKKLLANSHVIVAMVNKQAITGADLTVALQTMHPSVLKTLSNPQRRDKFLNQLAIEFALAQEADRRNLSESAEVTNSIRMARAMQTRYDFSQHPLPPPSEAELRTYYDSHKSRFSGGEHRRVSYATFASADAANSALKTLTQVRRWPVGTDSKTSQFLSREDMAHGTTKPLATVAFELEHIGELWPHPVDYAGDSILVRLDAKRRLPPRTFQQALPALRNFVAQARKNDRVMHLVEATDIEINEVVFSQLTQRPLANGSAP